MRQVNFCQRNVRSVVARAIYGKNFRLSNDQIASDQIASLVRRSLPAASETEAPRGRTSTAVKIFRSRLRERAFRWVVDVDSNLDVRARLVGPDERLRSWDE